MASVVPAAAMPFVLEALQAWGVVARNAGGNMAILFFLTPLGVAPGIVAGLLWERRWTLRAAVALAGLLAYWIAGIASLALFYRPGPDCVVGQSCP